MNTSRKASAHLLLTAVMSIFATAAADAASVRVASNGIDSNSCGPASKPCRSISRAIANANTGDAILVGPGRYGDVNNDGDFLDAGDEAADTSAGCIICIRKAVRISSTSGAAATIIDAAGTQISGLTNAVIIYADNTEFGGEYRGLTIANSTYYGLRVEYAANVKIVGNVSLNNLEVGFWITPARGVVRASYNIATGGGHGFLVFRDSSSSGFAEINRNTATDNTQSGFFVVEPRGPRPTVNKLIENVSSKNSQGMLIDAEGTVIKRNIVSANAVGIVNDSRDTLIQDNTIVGNDSYSIAFFPDAGTGNRVAGNNLFGNGQKTCAFYNESGEFVQAKNNYWGAATGSGSYPSDVICNISGSVNAVPFATSAFDLGSPSTAY